MKELSELFAARRRAPHIPYVIATVLRVEGSSYRRPGARMLVNINGVVAGSVSGGCLEKSVIAQAKLALLDHRPRLLLFDTTDQDDLALGSTMGCQGKIWIGLEILAPKAPWALEIIAEKIRRQRQSAVLITQIQGENETLRFSTRAQFSPNMAHNLSPLYREEIAEVFQIRKNLFVGMDMTDAALLEWMIPPVVLLIFGGGADVPSLVKIAQELGHEITVIERRSEFALPERFPGAYRVLSLKPQQISTFFRPDERTVAVIMNHHYETDRDTLQSLLPLELSYVAMLGPRRRTERILDELQVSGEIYPSLHAPAGLDLGAETPQQIALSILAEIQAFLSGRRGGMLKHRKAPIHQELTAA